MDSMVEALALNYLSYGFLTAVNNIWAWMAVMMAAVSFWMIRALSSPLLSKPEQRRNNQNVAPTSSSPPKLLTTGEASTAQPARVSTEDLSSSVSGTTTTTAMACCASESEGSPKGKFSVYYKEDDFRESDERGEEEGLVTVSDKSWQWGDDWERRMVMRMGGLGWYSCQDLTVLYGSVVRLWDGRRRRRDTVALSAGGFVWWS